MNVHGAKFTKTQSKHTTLKTASITALTHNDIFEVGKQENH